jgi:hypothetical protein
MNTPDLYHAVTKLRALKRLNHARGQRYERQLDDSLTKLAKWFDAPEGSEEARRAFELWLHSPLPSR